MVSAGHSPTGAKICSVEDCGRKHKAHGYCMTHYARLRRTGAVSDKPVRVFGTDEITYAGAHDRVERAKGKATDYACVCGCGQQAEQFAYDHSDPNQRYEMRPDHKGSMREVAYSVDPERYVPMTRVCHWRLDKEKA